VEARPASEVKAGDVVVVTRRHVGGPARTGEIVEVLGEDGLPHYLVRWESGRQSILYPGEGMTIRRSSPGARR
jgi:uncharacterized protein DUF1918